MDRRLLCTRNRSYVETLCATSLQPIIGEDGSQSFFNEIIGEAYHSKIGPITEAKHKFIEPSCLKELLLKDKEVKILDLFFGLGYNTGIALDFAHNITKNPKLEITGVENDPFIIEKIKDLEVPDWYKKWRDLLCENKLIKLCIVDVFDVIDKLPQNHFDIIFFDPFSHKVTPIFWEDSFLLKVFKLLAPNGTLTTYSGLKRVATLAENIGYSYKWTSPIGRKKPSLVIKH